MKRFGLTFATVILPVILVWIAVSWPLPRHVFTGIPFSAHRTESQPSREMVPGDHLQLLYQFWLAADMLAGRTPWFENRYEFNYEGDSSTRERSAYFMPFPIVYAVGHALGGRAFGWNFTGFMALLATHGLMTLLLRRYHPDRWIASFCALLAIVFPYRWITMMGGSPTGLSMMFVPMLFLGLDRAVRDERMSGGLVAGLAALLMYTSDPHTLFFGVLGIPLWCGFALLARPDFDWRRPGAYGKIARALLPAAVGVSIAVLLTQSISHDLSESQSALGRTIQEVAKYSPARKGLLAWRSRGMDGHIFLGWSALAALGLGWLFLTVRLWRSHRTGTARAPEIRNWVLLSLCGLGMVALVVLALGPNGPFGGRLFLAARRLIPPYENLRQPPKIFCLMPAALALAMTLVAGGLARQLTPLRLRVATGAIVALIVWEYAAQIKPALCLIRDEQGAYAAIRADADARGRELRALAVPLWPGDTHWSSLYEHYASLYRARMVNGYRPVVPRAYVENVFSRFDSVNMGELRVEQLDALLLKGIDYILLHEDAFPEKVSCYPVEFTRRRLMANPRLDFIAQGDRVWAWRILPKSRPAPGTPAEIPVFFPARTWSASRWAGVGQRHARDPGPASASHVSLSSKDAWIETPVTATVDAPAQRWLIRLRGRGELHCTPRIGGQPAPLKMLKVDSIDWDWVSVPLPPLDRYAPVQLRLTLAQGDVDVDIALLTAGDWQPPNPGDLHTFDASAFFHAGYTAPDRKSVVLRVESEPKDVVFYGLRMPFPAGTYDVQFEFTSAAPVGTRLGEMQLHTRTASPGPFAVVAGLPCKESFILHDNLPVTLEFKYRRKAGMEIRAVVLKRVE